MSLSSFYNTPELKNTKKAIFKDLYAVAMFLLPGYVLPLPPFREDLSDRELLDIVKESINNLKSHNSHMYIDQCTGSMKVLHDISIFDTGLDKNICHILNRYGVSTIGKLLSKNRIDLKSWRLIGKARYNQIIKFIDDYGFRFSDEIEFYTDILEEFILLTDVYNFNNISKNYPNINTDKAAFSIIINNLDKPKYTIEEYMKDAPTFNRYIEYREEGMSKNIAIYVRLDLKNLPVVSKKIIKSDVSFSNITLTSETTYNIYNNNTHVVGKTAKDADGIYLKYIVGKHIKLDNGDIVGWDILDKSIEM